MSNVHRPSTWQEVLSTEDEGQRLARVEGYNNYVDIVESQLGREIAALQEHSTEFFQASSFLEVETLGMPANSIQVEPSLGCCIPRVAV